jgi:hypothetical protein
MSDNGFEAWLRALARDIDVDEIARRTGIDPQQARQWADTAGEWVRGRAEEAAEAASAAADAAAGAAHQASRRGDRVRPDVSADDLFDSAAGPHPLDVPSEEQGLALAALDSGRWTIEPGTSALAAHGGGPGPKDALGLVRELRVRDWIGADGEVTLAGRHALARWLDAADPR